MAKFKTPIHALLLGKSGVGKDTFCATIPGSKLVWHLDGFGQETPYLDTAAEIGPVQVRQVGGMDLRYRDLIAEDGSLTRIEYLSSDDIERPTGIQLFNTRVSEFRNELEVWDTLVCGSLSSIAIEGRYYEQFVVSPSKKDTLKWFGAAATAVERLVNMQKGWPCDVFLLGHLRREDEKVMGDREWIADLPGKQLPYNAQRYFSEVWHMYLTRQGDGSILRLIQTQASPEFQAKSHINAPDPFLVLDGDKNLYDGICINRK